MNIELVTVEPPRPSCMFVVILSCRRLMISASVLSPHFVLGLLPATKLTHHTLKSHNQSHLHYVSFLTHIKMSEALLDEVEAITSIYGDETLVPEVSDDVSYIYILTLPPDATMTGASLRIQFSPSYPEEPPAIIGTHSSGASTKPGAAARDLALFRNALGEVFEPGSVCLFDAIEKAKELLASDSNTGTEPDGGIEPELAPEPEQQQQQQQQPGGCPSGLEKEQGEEPPPWTLSPPLTELKSTFIARCAPVKSPVQAASYLQHLLSTDKRVRMATHNITAWRIRGENGTSYQDCDDDGETAAGGRLLHLMQVMDLWDVMVVVSRWYGGQKLVSTLSFYPGVVWWVVG